MDRIQANGSQQRWDGLEVVDGLPERGRGVKVTRPFEREEVVCDYSGRLLSHKDGKTKFAATPENEMGFMFSFRHQGLGYWRDATEEVPGPGRLINHSRCHANVSNCNSVIN